MIRHAVLFRLLVPAAAVLCAGGAVAGEKPLMKDFMGINGHFHFKPALYKQTCRLVRNYHNINWDAAKVGAPVDPPHCVNGVNWDTQVYGKWKREGGFEASLCAQFGRFGRANARYRELWQGRTAWAHAYGKALASCFGPSGPNPLVTSIEIGNEPGGGREGFDPQLYRAIFRHMAQGIRAADPKLKIVTCTAHARPADKYSVNLDATFAAPELIALFDVISVHVYAVMPHPPKPWPANRGQWDRSYPEDPAIPYLRVVQEVIDWRNRKARGKQIWITEFGWDSVTPERMRLRTGWMKKLNWQGVTDLQQAQYIVRSFLLFSAMDVDRAYLYFFNDNNSPSVHGASGLTRNFKPKMSFWAMRQLYATLGEYRFSRSVCREPGRLYVYAFQHGNDPGRTAWVAWSPTGPAPGVAPAGKTRAVTLRGLPAAPTAIKGLALAPGDAPDIAWQQAGEGAITLEIGESPVYILMRRQR